MTIAIRWPARPSREKARNSASAVTTPGTIMGEIRMQLRTGFQRALRRLAPTAASPPNAVASAVAPAL